VLHHPDVGWHHHYQQHNQTPRCRFARLWDKHAEAACDLRCATQQYELMVSRQIVRHDVFVSPRQDEVRYAGGDVKPTHQNPASAHRALLKAVEHLLLRGRVGLER